MQLYVQTAPAHLTAKGGKKSRRKAQGTEKKEKKTKKKKEQQKKRNLALQPHTVMYSHWHHHCKIRRPVSSFLQMWKLEIAFRGPVPLFISALSLSLLPLLFLSLAPLQLEAIGRSGGWLGGWEKTRDGGVGAGVWLHVVSPTAPSSAPSAFPGQPYPRSGVRCWAT